MIDSCGTVHTSITLHPVNQWTVPQLSITIIYNSLLLILIKWIKVMIARPSKKAYFLFVINLTTRTKEKYRKGRR